MGGNESFFGHNIARDSLGGVGGGEDEKMKPKPIQELSLGAESSVTVSWKGFFTQSQVRLASIVDLQSWTKVLGHFCVSGVFFSSHRSDPSPHPTNNVGRVHPEFFQRFNFV